MTLSELTTLEACAEFVGIDLNTINVSGLPADLQQFTLGMAHRAIICRALNKVDHEEEPPWIPNYHAGDEKKYHPYCFPGKYSLVDSGFGLGTAYYGYSDWSTSVGARLSLRCSELVLHMIQHFRQVLVDTMLVNPNPNPKK